MSNTKYIYLDGKNGKWVNTNLEFQIAKHYLSEIKNNDTFQLSLFQTRFQLTLDSVADSRNIVIGTDISPRNLESSNLNAYLAILDINYERFVTNVENNEILIVISPINGSEQMVLTTSLFSKISFSFLYNDELANEFSINKKFVSIILKIQY